MFEAFFELCPTPSALLRRKRSAALARLLRPLGLWRRRLGVLTRLTKDWMAGKPPAEIYGVGPYGLDAHAIFVEGRLDVRPTDHFLKPYLAWKKRHGRA